MLNERSQTQTPCVIWFCYMKCPGWHLQIENRFVLPGAGSVYRGVGEWLLKGSGFHLEWWKRPGVRLWWRLHNLVSILNWTSKGKNVIVCKLYLSKVIERKREREREKKERDEGKKEITHIFIFPEATEFHVQAPVSSSLWYIQSQSVLFLKHLGEAWGFFVHRHLASTASPRDPR